MSKTLTAALLLTLLVSLLPLQSTHAETLSKECSENEINEFIVQVSDDITAIAKDDVAEYSIKELAEYYLEVRDIRAHYQLNLVCDELILVNMFTTATLAYLGDSVFVLMTIHADPNLGPEYADKAREFIADYLTTLDLVVSRVGELTD